MMLWQRILKEPLVHFLLIALIAYWFQAALNSEEAMKKPIGLSTEEIAKVAAIWRMKLEREPHDVELKAALKQELFDKILFEEALRLGLHRADPTIYATLVARTKQLLQAPILPDTIADEQLYRYYQEHQDYYRQKSSISFSHVVVSIEHEHPFRLANALLRLLEEGNVSDGDLAYFGDETTSNNRKEMSQQRIETEFGKSFYVQLSRFKLGVWSGPVVSNMGIHLVRVQAKHGGDVLPFDTIKDLVVSDYIDDAKREHYDEKLRHIRAQYRIRNEVE